MIKSLWIIGAGKMGQALYRGWRAASLNVDQIVLIDPAEKPSDLLLHPGDLWQHTPPQDTTPDIVIIAVKPQASADVLPLYRHALSPETLVISIMAGVPLSRLTHLCANPAQPIVRVIPNTPAMVGQGMTAGYANAYVNAEQSQITHDLFDAVGRYLWVEDEDAIHTVTGLAGSGPAYVFALIEALAQAGIAQGMPADVAMILARQTVVGSAALAAAQPNTSAETLRQNVTSPNGTTAAGLAVLQASENGLNDLITRTVDAATQRSVELGS